MLELDDLRRRFGDVEALRGLSLTVRPGELRGFLGPNGAGKTTAMRAVLGITRLDAGEVRWGGVPIDTAVRRRIGYLPEERGLYPRMRVAEQLVYLGRLRGLSRQVARRRAGELLERLGLAERRDDDTDALSLGNQQRVQLAAALLHDPELLVLDEPFSGLDPLAVDQLSELLREHADRGAAVVLSSHQLDLVEDLCDTVTIVAGGRSLLDGPVQQLRDGGGRRLVVRTDARAWLAALPAGATLRDDRDGQVVLDLAPEVDPTEVLTQLAREGELRRVRLEPPSLSELFRDAVQRAAADELDTEPVGAVRS